LHPEAGIAFIFIYRCSYDEDEKKDHPMLMMEIRGGHEE